MFGRVAKDELIDSTDDARRGGVEYWASQLRLELFKVTTRTELTVRSHVVVVHAL